MRHLLLLLIVFSPTTFAYYSVLDNAEITKDNVYKLTGSGQLMTNNGGANMSGRVDAPITEDVGFRGLVGFGKIDFYVGALARWMPIPDVDNQPAAGVNAGVLYASDKDWTDTIVRIEPLISKKVEMKGNVFTPYLSLPIGLRMRDSDVDNDDDITLQAVIGSQLQVEDIKDWQFIAELGVDLNEAPSYITVGAIYYYDTGVSRAADQPSADSIE